MQGVKRTTVEWMLEAARLVADLAGIVMREADHQTFPAGSGGAGGPRVYGGSPLGAGGG